MKALVLSLLLAFAACVQAADTAQPAAADPALEKRLNELSAELRCLVCQNQSLADSHADLAIDLKNQVRDMMRAGKSDEEIKAYLTQRYGDFVLYRPPVKGSTWLLWAGPFALLIAAVAGLVWLVRRRRTAVAEAPRTLSEAEQARIRELLGGSDGAETRS